MKAFPRKFLFPRRVAFVACALAAACGVPAPESFAEPESTAKSESCSAEEFARAAEKFWDKPAEALFEAGGLWEGRRAQKTEAGEKSPETLFSVYLRGEKIFGVPAEEAKARARDGRLAGFEIMFFNKGDSAAREGFGSKSGKSSDEKEKFVRKSWKASFEAVREALKPLGEETHGRAGASKALRRRVSVWKNGGTAFVLEAEENEFLRVSVVPEAGVKDALSVKADRADADVRKSVVRRPNGDVFIGELPMIDQGGKGYCVPATVERVLRHYGVGDVDMHEIAELAGTSVGGGTSVRKVVAALTPVVKKSRLKFSSVPMSFPKIKLCADKGVPMMWCMFSAPEYLARLRENTHARETAPDFAAFARELRRQNVPEISSEQRKYAHMCLIIGYNAKTKEICVSDSWGDSAAERWISFEDAAAFSQKEPLWVLER
ncbi:MAG: hypothetical protein ACI4QA_02985 [Candidatus Spyradosoma sp.]